MSDLKDLAREYAALVPEWATDGVSCRDHRSGTIWRKVGAVRWCNDYGVVIDIALTSGHVLLRNGLQDAIAAGPDLDDNATLGALLLNLDPEAQLCRCCSWNADGSPHPYVWAGPIDAQGNGEIGADAAEAVIRACIAQAMATVTP